MECEACDNTMHKFSTLRRSVQERLKRQRVGADALLVNSLPRDGDGMLKSGI